MEIKTQEEKDDQTLVQLKGRFRELMNSMLKAIYQKPGANPNDMENVTVSGTFRNMLREHGTSGPGQTEPEFLLNLLVEGEICPEPEIPEKVEELPWEDLTEIKGVGEARKEKIKDVLLEGRND